MSRTKKDLKSHKKGYGRYGNDPQRKLTPFIHDANKIAGDNEVLCCKPQNDLSQDDFGKPGGNFYGPRQVRSIRKRERAARDYEKSRARGKIKQFDKKNLIDITDFTDVKDLDTEKYIREVQEKIKNK